MKPDRLDMRASSTVETIGLLSGVWFVVLSIGFASQQIVGAQQPHDNPLGSSLLTAEQVVERLDGMNLRRAQALHSYHGTRTYRVEYRGFPSTTSAEMVVDVVYRAPDTKEFVIRSSIGSKLIIDKVFKKLLQAEEEAQSSDARRRGALSRENYTFTMVGYESGASHSFYVLTVEPKTRSKLLFRGRIWVDADDFAVVRLEAEPAKNPSFWTTHSAIEQLYVKVNGFWLPERNHSVSSIRLGGRAELTIDYQNYLITNSDPIDSVSTPKTAQTANLSAPQSPTKHLK